MMSEMLERGEDRKTGGEVSEESICGSFPPSFPYNTLFACHVEGPPHSKSAKTLECRVGVGCQTIKQRVCTAALILTECDAFFFFNGAVTFTLKMSSVKVQGSLF